MTLLAVATVTGVQDRTVGMKTSSKQNKENVRLLLNEVCDLMTVNT